MNILKNLKQVQVYLNENVKLIAVTKNQTIKTINQVLFLGITDLGENKVQEAKEKKALIKGNAKWHMIGHLQTNKAKEAVEIFDMIHSLDSLKLAAKIDAAARSKGKVMAVLVEVNISREPQKHGITEEQVLPFIREASQFKNIKILGLMCMAPYVEAEKTKPYFSRMKELFEKIKKESIPNTEMKYLSMGMSNDYPVAIAEGSNMVRIGSALFH